MPAIGSLRFKLNDGFDSGLALRLVSQPENETSGRYANSELLASPSTPYVICRFNGASDQSDAVRKGADLLQQALDLHSMLGHADLSVKDINDEHIAWWGKDGKPCLSVTTTTTFSTKVGHAELVGRDSQGNIVPPHTVVPLHHVGFRFFRQAQVSDDLYDAFRSMYLAFESLLSSRYPKAKEQEIQWLKRALSASMAGLDLRSLCPVGTPDCVSHILSRIYTSARLPLFHAKDGTTYFAPGGPEADRALVQSALSLLTEIVVRMAAKWYSARRRGGGVNLKLLTEGFRAQLADCQVVLSDEPTDIDRLKDETQAEASAQRGIATPGAVSEFFDGAPRTNVSGSFGVPTLGGRTSLHAVYVVKEASPLIGVTPDTVIDVEGFDRLDVHVFLRGTNANQPKSQFAR